MADERPSPDLLLLRVLFYEVATQCRLVLFAASDLQGALEAIRARRGMPRNQVELLLRPWVPLQGIMIAAANIAKILWGSDERKTTRARRERREATRQHIRKALAVTDASPLKARGVRNWFKHIDEKLEERMGEEKPGPIVMRGIGPPNMIHGAKPDSAFGHFDPATWELSFWDRSLPVLGVVREVERILPLAEAAAQESFTRYVEEFRARPGTSP